jgi:hypothetical protein
VPAEDDIAAVLRVAGRFGSAGIRRRRFVTTAVWARNVSRILKLRKDVLDGYRTLDREIVEDEELLREA